MNNLKLLIAISEKPNETINHYANMIESPYCYTHNLHEKLRDQGLIKRNATKKGVYLNLTAKGKKTVGAARLIVKINEDNKK